MSTGDIKGNIAQLQRCLQHLKYSIPVDEIGLTLGDPLAALPILNFVLLKYSRHVAAYILSKGVQLQGKTDEGFVKNAFKLFRDHLGLRVIITPAQFLEQGFAERKVLLLIDVVKAARQIHQAGVKQERAKLENVVRQSPSRFTQKPASPIHPTVQLYSSPPKAEHLQRVAVSNATDAAQDIYELIQSEEPDLTATAIAMLASPARKSPKRHQAAAAAGSRSRGSSPGQQLNSTSSWHWQQQQQQQQVNPDGSSMDYSMLQPRTVLPRPASQRARQQQYQQEEQQRQQYQRQHVFQQQEQEQMHYADTDHNATATQEQLIAAGLLPVPRGGLSHQPAARQDLQQQDREQPSNAASENDQQQQQQEQQRRPVRACLWPQQEPQLAAAAAVGAAGGRSDSGADSCNFRDSPQQQQCEELIGTTMFMPAPRAQRSYESESQRLEAAAADAGAVAAAEGSVAVSVLQQQLLESQAVVAELQQRLELAEQQLQERRSAAAKFEESASARITLLEGRLKFLENLVHASQHHQPVTAAGGLHDSSSRSKAAAAAMGSNRSYLPASHFERVSQPPSPATIHTTAAPRASPARAAVAAVAGDSTDWRSAASAAAAAVVAGLTASPMKSPLRSPFRAVDNAQRGNLWRRDSPSSTEPPKKAGLEHSEGCAGGDAVRQQGLGNHGTTAAAEHAAQGRMAASMDAEALRRSCDQFGAKGAMQGSVRVGGNGGYHSAGSQAAPDKENRDAGMLIDKLASRAVEAAAMLEAFRAGRLP